MKLEVTLDGVTRTVDVRASGGGWTVVVDGGEAREIVGGRWLGTTWRLGPPGAERVLDLALEGDRVSVVRQGWSWSGAVEDPRRKALALGGGTAQGTITTQMPGAVVRLLVAVGDAVQKGQVVVVVEAMKMENELQSPVDGRVSEVRVAAGQAVESGAVLLVVTPD